MIGKPLLRTYLRAAAKGVGFAFCLVLAYQGPVAAQTAQSVVYTPGQLSEPPDIADRAKAAEIIQKAYPLELKEKKVGGTVQLRLIVNADGTVEPASVQVIAASNTDLGRAAAAASKQIRFKPGKVNGKPVRTVVVFPLTFGMR